MVNEIVIYEFAAQSTYIFSVCMPPSPSRCMARLPSTRTKDNGGFQPARSEIVEHPSDQTMIKLVMLLLGCQKALALP
jgi:hypothetical protein